MFFLYLFIYLLTIYVSYKFVVKVGKNTKEENDRPLTLKEKIVCFIWFTVFISSQILMISYVMERFDIIGWTLSI